MRIYFLSSKPCALYIGGAYFGMTSDFERFVNLDLADNLPVRFEPTNAHPVTFFLNEQIQFQPPARCEVYLLKDGLAVYAKEFTPLDFTLQPITQAQDEDCLATVFRQGDTQLSLQTATGVFTAPLPACFQRCEIAFHGNLVFLACEEQLAVFTKNGKRLLLEYTLSHFVKNGKLTAVFPLSDRYRRTAKCVYELGEESLLRTEYTLLQGEEREKESLLPYAFFESVRIGAPYEHFLSEELAKKSDELSRFLGKFLFVIPTDDERVCTLVYEKSPRLFQTREYTVTVENGKITDIQG